MKKILIITDMYPHARNPVSGVFVQQQVEYLKKHYSVKVIASDYPAKQEIERSTDRGYELIYAHFPQIRFMPLNVFNYWRYVVPYIKELLSDWKPDIVHVHDFRHIPELFVLAWVLRFYQGKRFLTVHNNKTFPAYAETWLHALIYRLTLKTSYQHWTHVFCVNERLRLSLKEYIPLSQISTIGNALPDIAEMSVPIELTDWLRDDSFKVIAVGNLVNTKGFDLLLQAVQHLIKDNHALQVLIVGSGGEKKHLEELIEELYLKDHVKMQPALINPIVRSLYKYFDSMILPSYSESFGIVYLEAMSAGLPVVGVKGQGIDGIITEGVSGLLTEPHSVTDLISKMSWLIQHPQERQVIGEAGRLLVEDNFRMDSLINKLIEQYEA